MLKFLRPAITILFLVIATAIHAPSGTYNYFYKSNTSPLIAKTEIVNTNDIEQHTDDGTSSTSKDNPITGFGPAITVSAQGWVGNQYGSGISGVNLHIRSLGFDNEEPTTFTIKTDQFGNFYIPDLVPGRQYSLTINPGQQYNGFQLSSFTNQTADLLQSIILDEISLVSVDGMIVDANLAPISNFKLELRHLEVEFPTKTINSDSSGFFHLDGFPAGKVKLVGFDNGIFRIQGLELDPSEYRNITIVINQGNYHLSGWIYDKNQLPLGGVQLTLKSSIETNGYHSHSYRTATSSQSGAFEFSYLAGHSATLKILARGFKTLSRKHEFSSQFDVVNIYLDDN